MAERAFVKDAANNSGYWDALTGTDTVAAYQAALRAVYSADPLPALPEASTLNTLGVHFEFVGN